MDTSVPIFLFCPFQDFPDFFGTFPTFSRDFPDSFGIFPIFFGDFLDLPLPFLLAYQSTYKEHSQKGPRHTRDISRRSGKPPGLETPSIALSSTLALSHWSYHAWQEHLAWVLDDQSGERYMKCLLCNKWVQDDSSHAGTTQNLMGSKEHVKNLRNVNKAWVVTPPVRPRTRRPQVSATGRPSCRGPSSTR